MDNPEDFVRMEIESVFSRNLPVVPILVHRATMPRKDSLPKSIAELSDRQAVSLGATQNGNSKSHNSANTLSKSLKSGSGTMSTWKSRCTPCYHR